MSYTGTMNRERLTQIEEIRNTAQTEVSDSRIEANEMEQEVQELERELLEAQLVSQKKENVENEAKMKKEQIEVVHGE